MKHFTRMTALLLVLVMLLTALASCKETSGNTSGEKQTEADGFELPEGIDYTLQVNDYKGATCTVALNIYSNMDSTEVTGDTVVDTIYKRNAKVEDLYKVSLQFPEMPEMEDYTQLIVQSIMAGDNDFQLIGGRQGQLAELMLSSTYMQDLLDVPYLEFDMPWWPKEFQQSANVGNVLYSAVGTLDTTFYDYVVALTFNKELAADLGIGDLYALTREGNWTLDKLIEYSRLAEGDLDGNGIMEPAFDRFGLAIHRNFPVDAFVTAFNVPLTEFDDEGVPHLLPLTDHYVEVEDKMRKFIAHDNSVNYQIGKNPTEDASFLEGRALFEGNRMWRVLEYRAMEYDFGILPYPKWDENQDKYYTYTDVADNSSFAIPVTTDATMPANLLEALSYYGYFMIKPAFYDKTLNGKLVRDKESSEMLDLIYDNIKYDFIQLYDAGFYPAPNMLLRISLWDDISLTTEYAKNRKMYEKKMEELVDKLF